MWFLRAIFPIGAAANIGAILLAAYLISSDPNPPFVRASVATVLIYVLCMCITVKEALTLAVVAGLFSSCYFLLVKFFPGYDFEYSGYAFSALTFLPLALFGVFRNKKDQAAVKRYFLKRQLGTLEDVVKMTGLAEAEAQRQIDTFLKSGELAIKLEKPLLYSWTEERDFPEGVTSTVLDIQV
jgi:hypothetical protein